MSNEAITWALRKRLPPGHSTAKHVLTVLANQANGDPYRGDVVTAFPSVAYLVEATDQNRKTVLANLALLREWGIIEDTGKRVGKTGQIVVYRIHCEPDLFAERSQYRNSSNTGTVASAKQALNRDSTDIGTGTDIGFKQSQYRSETDPILGHGTKSNQEQPQCLSAQARADDGVGEDEAEPAIPVGKPAGHAAAAMNRAGLRVTSMHPNLIAACAEGVTVEHLLEVASNHPEKNAGWVIATARGERSAAASPIPNGNARGRGPPRPKVNDDFSDATYASTPDDELPPELRDDAVA